MSDTLININDPVVKAAEALLDEARANLSAGKLTKAEFDEIALDILDFQKVADIVSDVTRRKTIYNTYQTVAAVLGLVLPFA